MKKITLSLFLCFYVAFTFGQTDVRFNENNTFSEVISTTESEIIVKNNISNFQINKIDSKIGAFNKITIENYTSESKIGTPKLPMFHQLIEIPTGAEVIVKILNQKTETINLDNYGGFKLIPNQPSLSKSEDPSKVPFHFLESVYNTNQFSNDPIASVEKLGNMRSRTIGNLKISPFSYNPVTNELIIITEITVKISYKNINTSLQRENKKKYSSELFDQSFQNIIRHKEVNIEKDLIITYPTTYVIVSDPMFQTALQPFIQWKTQKGFKVIEAYTSNPSVGNTTNSIRTYLQNLYTSASPTNPAPSYVLFVGDVAQIPSFGGTTGTHISDLYYCEYDGGSDYFPEVYYGRFSANNVGELQPQIDKTLEYEKYLFPDDSFLNNVIMISGVDSGFAPIHGNGQINYGTSTYFNAGNGFNCNTWLYPESEGPCESAIKTVFNNGCSFVNYTAHGYEEGWADPAFDISEVAGLTNSHKYPTMIGNCCLTNTFTLPTCFGEGLMRAENKGAIGYIGGSNSTLWDEDYYWGTGFKAITLNPIYESAHLGAYDCEFHTSGEAISNWYVTQSQMIFAGNMAVTASGSSNTVYYWEIYHLMGDPSLMTYMTQADPMVVTHIATDVVGTSSVAVHAEEHAYVAISVNGVLLDAKYTGTGTDVILNFDPINTIETLNIVVTKQNKQPYFGTVDLIAPTGTDYIVLFSHLNDDATENNNGIIEYNEFISLDIELKNIGDVIGNDVIATLSTTDSYITIGDNTENWGTIIAGTTEMIVASYDYQVASNIPDQHVVDFLLTITDSDGHTWTNHIYVTVSAPKIEVLNLTIDDAAGNGNGRLDAGETVNLLITAHNIGHADLTSSVGTITTSSPELAITVNSETIGTMDQITTVTGNYTIVVSPSAVYGTVANITNIVGDANYLDSKLFSLTIGLFSEDFESNTFTEFNWNNSSSSNWITTTESPYEGIYCSKSGVISDNSSTDLTIVMNISSAEEISFMKKVSSEASYDFLSFYIDNVLQSQWSGTIDWSPETFAVTTGIHTFKWSYSKDESASAGSDAAWLDYILFPPSIAIDDASIEENELISMDVYPNPVRDELTIMTGNDQAKFTIDIKDLQGRIVYSNTLVANGKLMVNTSSFANGMYMVEASNGISTMQRKIIKQ